MSTTLNLPGHGDANWDTKLNAALTQLASAIDAVNSAVVSVQTVVTQIQATTPTTPKWQ